MAGLEERARAAVRPSVLRFNNSLRYLSTKSSMKSVYTVFDNCLWFIYIFSVGFQTLGEEYVNIVQVDPSKRKIPTRARRGLFILFHTFFPYLLDKVLVCLENELEGGQESQRGISRRQTASKWWSLESWLKQWMQQVVGMLSEPQRKACLPVLFVLQQSLTLLHRLHVALFYISGSFYHLSKRTAGISYVGVQLHNMKEHISVENTLCTASILSSSVFFCHFSHQRNTN